MQILAFMLVMLAIMASFDTKNLDQANYEVNQANTIAGQMAYYHNLSIQACTSPNICQDGVITPNANSGGGNAGVSNSGGVNIGNGNFGYKGTITAVYDSATKMVITTWQPSQTLNDPNSYYGLISSALHNFDPGTINVGPYNATTQSIGAIPLRVSTTDPTQGSIVPPTPLPQVVGGLTLENNEPVIATLVR